MKRLTTAALAATLGLTMAACSNAAEGGDQGDTVKVAVISPIESQAISMPYAADSAVAAIKAINAKGGVGGKQIEYTTCNDHYDVERLRGCLQDAVRDDAVAIFGLVTPYGPQVWPVLEQAKLPALAPAPLSRDDGKSAMSYPLEGGTIAYMALPQVAAELADSKVAVPMHIDQAQAKTTQEYFEYGAEKAGLRLAEQITVPADAFDYAPYVERAVKSGADTILSGLSAATNLRLWQALKAAGSDIKVVVSSGAAPESVVKEAGDAAEGSFLVAGTPHIDDSTPTGKQFLEEMKQHAPDSELTAVGLRSWAGVHLFDLAAKNIDGDITRESLVEALNNINGEKFLWIDSLSFNSPGPFDQAPRVPAWDAFTSKINAKGEAEPNENLNPFGG